MNIYNKVLIALVLASSFLMVGCITTKNHDEGVHEKMQDQDRHLE